MKKYDVGLLVGRFNVFHIGHKSLADLALTMCDRLLILVGSAQESGTLRNPFSVKTRIKMINEISWMLLPFMPETAQKIKEQFKGPKIKAAAPLFPRL